MNAHPAHLTVAIVGAGPSGLFAAAELLGALHDVHVVIYDRLPTPMGLVRYGIAPDHLRMKSIESKLRATLADDRVSFVGNVELGSTISLQELASHHHATILALGASAARKLAIPGATLRGHHSAGEIVSWYNGHPDAEPPQLGSSVVVAGAGNVALDVARVLLRGADGLARTDVPEQVLDALERQPISRVDLVARRGPTHSRFSPTELLDLDELEGIRIEVDPRDLELTEEEQTTAASSRDVEANLTIFRRWADRGAEPSPGGRTLRFRFWTEPLEIGGQEVEGVDRVCRLVARQVRHGRLDGQPTLVTLETDAVVSAVGYAVSPAAGIGLGPGGGVEHERGRLIVPSDQPRSRRPRAAPMTRRRSTQPAGSSAGHRGRSVRTGSVREKPFKRSSPTPRAVPCSGTRLAAGSRRYGLCSRTGACAR